MSLILNSTEGNSLELNKKLSKVEVVKVVKKLFTAILCSNNFLNVLLTILFSI